MAVFTRQPRHTTDDAPDDTEPPAPAGRLTRWRAAHPTATRVLGRTATGLSAALVLIALLMPNTLETLGPGTFLRIPVEAIISAALLLVLPRRPRLVAAVVAGLGLAVLTALNLLDIGFNEYLGRGFNLILDWGLLDDAQSYMEDAMGRAGAVALAIGAVALVVLVCALMTLATVRLSNVLVRHRTVAVRSTLAAGVVWTLTYALGLQFAGLPIAADNAAALTEGRAERVQATLRDEAAFAREARTDAFAATPGEQLVPDLRGKDVIFTFIESYGRKAIEDPLISPGVRRTLDTSTDALTKAGFAAKSGWLTSATFGGSSWLGHSTFLSGLWIDSQQRYATVTSGDHLTLTKAFQKTGAWQTVGIMPGVQKGWPEAEFYGLDDVYDAFELGYKGPKFSWSTMPDQYTLEAFQRLVHGKKRDKPLMAEVILTSSHQPWSPLPKMVDWEDLGDGSLFGPIQKAGTNPADIIADSTRSKQEYGKSVEYSVTSLTQWLQRYGTEDTVLVFLGDHQPIVRVSGYDAGRDVPVSIVAKDPKVLDRIAGWGWSDGLRPAQDAPVWKMSDFRDRFLTAYGSTPSGKTG
ncbi:CDP-alcohol phosphatidyltransferase [Streptomyces spinoverrucosus]|uniref:CDP-alcohol phosphatidyltransferase n=1 Tax=Streptomyces spinoverrucosus TaxID=284043 RepID=UPI0018C3A9B9|nr:CDP-alcohol phosphatidyltransferase [Streptomyces spinoverrucosus]MBG0855404.1 CDP-alcohol phosphatidyltransferase [Streptomyces spinoverrucosus]